MSHAVNDVYTYCAQKLLESPANFADGSFSQASFLLYFVDVLNDFCASTGISKMVFTQPIELGVPEYGTPDALTRVELAFVGAVYIAKKTEEELDGLNYSWRTDTGMPSAWHEDGLPIETLEVYPTPAYNGPQYNVTTSPPGVTGKFNPMDGNLTVVGTQIPAAITYTLSSTIPLVPDSSFPYLCWGVLAKIWRNSDENRDLQRASYADARYREGLNLFKAIMKEACLEEPDAIFV
jgi:hypothetical protein